MCELYEEERKKYGLRQTDWICTNMYNPWPFRIGQFANKIDEIGEETDNSADVIAIMVESRKWRISKMK